MKNVKIVMNKSRGTLFVMGLNEFYAKQIFAMVFLYLGYFHHYARFLFVISAAHTYVFV